MSKEVLKMRRWVAVGVLIVALIVGGIVGVWFVHWTGREVFGAAKVPVKLAGHVDAVRLGAFQNGFASVVRPALPAVVNISTTKIVRTQNNFQGFFNDPFFRQFFGNPFGQSMGPQTEREHSLGSGVIINPNGYIITNNHVISGATDIKVFTRNKKEFNAKLIGTDPRSDIAVLKIEATGLPTLTLGDSSQLEVGDVVFAIGDPFGIGETATMGIVSATGRSGLGIEGYENFIQTDAAINPGNSGGALVDLHGDLVGINTAILTGNAGGGNEGIGFAIPINMARNVMDQLIAHGKVIRGYLGLYPEDLTPELAKQFGFAGEGGALIGDVSPDTPASKAGLEKGDIIVELNGQPVRSANDLRLRISQTAPGTKVELTIFRDGKTRSIAVTLGELPLSAEAATPEAGGGKALQGVQVQALTPDVAQQLGLPASTTGVVISAVDPSSPAAEAGLSRGDVIQEVNHKPVRSVAQYREALAGTDDQPVLLLVNHGGITEYVVISPH